MSPKRPSVLWSSLLMLVGTGSLVLMGFVTWWLISRSPASGESIQLGPVAIPNGVFVMIACMAVAAAGWLWMIRILRGAGDEPPPWRYRDR